ncbi:N-acetyl-gamma-glutamyl-phosphate reductase [Enterococcus alishanensis]|uniref:N-acetyl-gamma-glutamyl-phosphate reductase n=1 Tax=Enterococcus alishanensis TaxID=1303817 RepID=A0ABS6TBC2_9ENTE|nr:N-acetyl-gamma-glutamyl-phosphate reductase [Enterococcus alishanensis]MBV7390200.1 N-acetyl-gamma-glutamyl-phosphate reductase [Enterococcus alishanensis]
MKVAIIGVTGYSGLELVRLLKNHPKVEIVSLHSHSQNNQDISNVYPHLKRIIDLTLEEINPKKIMATADLVFFATPSGISKDLAADFSENNFPMIDLSGDFRLKEIGAYEKWYQKEPASPAILSKAEYGLADLNSEYSSNFIANPGCYATCALLSLAPLVQEKWIDPDSIIIDGKSGLSGAGKNLSVAAHFEEAHDNMSLYKMNSHQHIPEIVQQLKSWDKSIPAIQFSTSLIPVSRGIFMTSYLKAKRKLTTSQVHQLYQSFYQDKPFIRVQAENQFPSIKQVVGSNYCDIGVAFNEATNVITVVSVLDNLVKGAAGQAIQNLNHLMKIPEITGLDFVPVYP